MLEQILQQLETIEVAEIDAELARTRARMAMLENLRTVVSARVLMRPEDASPRTPNPAILPESVMDSLSVEDQVPEPAAAVTPEGSTPRLEGDPLKGAIHRYLSAYGPKPWSAILDRFRAGHQATTEALRDASLFVKVDGMYQIA